MCVGVCLFAAVVDGGGGCFFGGYAKMFMHAHARAHVCVCVFVCVCVCFKVSSLFQKHILISKESEVSQDSTRLREICCIIAKNKMHVPHSLTKPIFSENLNYNISQC